MLTVYVVQMWHRDEGADIDSLWSSRDKAEARVAALIKADPFYKEGNGWDEYQVVEMGVDPDNAGDPANTLT